MKNKIDDLRDHLFATLEALRDPDKPMEIERARTIATVAQTVVNSAKVEVDYIKATGAKGSAFIPDAPALAPPKPDAEAAKKPRVIVHRIKG